MLIRRFQFRSLSHVHKLTAIFQAHHSHSVCFVLFFDWRTLLCFNWKRANYMRVVRANFHVFFSFTLFAVLIAAEAKKISSLRREKKITEKKTSGRKDVEESRVGNAVFVFAKRILSCFATAKKLWNNRILNWTNGLHSFWRFRTKTLWLCDVETKTETKTISFSEIHLLWQAIIYA